MTRIISQESGVSYLGMGVAAIIFDSAGRILLIRENYGNRRYGPPGGQIEAGESPRDAMIREAREEVCVEVTVERLVGMYYNRDERPWLAFAFRCDVKDGVPSVPATGEIAEVGWHDPAKLPSPLTNLAPHAIADALSGEYGVVREFDAWR